jgi:hypothetical protein
VAAYLSALAVCATSVAVGAAICCRARAWSWTAPPVGLAAVMLLALVAVRLPGHGATAAGAIVLASIASVAVVARRGVDVRPLLEALPVAGVVLALCSLPFIANDRIGELGAYILDDLSVHMAQADALRSVGAAADITPSGYPNGPHALVAALAGGLGVGSSPAFTGLLLATPVLTAMAALGALRGARWYLRLPAAALTGIPYLAVSYFAQGAFKEPLVALFLLGFVLTLHEARGPGRPDRRHAVALVLTTAAAIAVFGIAAVAWPAAALAWLAALELARGWRPNLGRWASKRVLGAAGAVLVAGLAVAAISGAREFFDTGPGRYLTEQEAGGNFGRQLSPLEALGVWRQPDFRVPWPSPLLEPGVLLACAVTLFGLAWCRRRREWALLAGALGGVSVYAVARPFTLAYFSGKALAIVAPLLTLIAVKALAEVASGARAGPARRHAPAVAAAAVLGAYLLMAGASSTLALRGAHVRPTERGPDLAAFRSAVDGDSLVYVGRDNFAPWELRGADLHGFQSYDTPLGVGMAENPEKRAEDGLSPTVDVDSVEPGWLASARYLVTPRSPYGSRVPSNFRAIARTRWHVLWQRRGPTLPRSILAEGDAPGAVLDCGTARGRRLAQARGFAYVRPEPVVGPADGWRSPGDGAPLPGLVPSAAVRVQELELGPGVWDISLRYFSDVPLRVSAGSLRATLPAYVADRTTFASAGRVATDGGPLAITVAVPARRRIETLREVDLGAVAATRVDDRGRLMPLSRACGRYVDWFRLSEDPA